MMFGFKELRNGGNQLVLDPEEAFKQRTRPMLKHHKSSSVLQGTRQTNQKPADADKVNGNAQRLRAC
jgi:hypothetical protein